MQPKLNTLFLGLIALSLVAIAFSLVQTALRQPRFQPIMYHFEGENNVVLVDVRTGKTYVYNAEKKKLLPVTANYISY